MRISDWSSDVCSSDLAEGEAEDHRRKKSEQQVAHESDRDRIAAEEAGEHLPEQLPVQHDDREDRARLDSDVEDRPARGVITEQLGREDRSEEHTSELQSLMRISYAVFCLKKKHNHKKTHHKR